MESQLKAFSVPKTPSGLKIQVFFVREIIIVSTMTPFFIAFLALVASMSGPAPGPMI
jgi:hypothetical protein